MQIQELEKSINKRRKEKRFLQGILREIRFLKEEKEHGSNQTILSTLESELDEL